MQVQTYLNFGGCCEEALDFYRRALGAEVKAVHRFKECPPGSCPPGAEDKIMHAHFCIGETVLMASDNHCASPTDFKGFSLSITAPNATEAERLFAALSDGGQVQMPLAKTFFAERFGMVADRFGLCWMIHVAA